MAAAGHAGQGIHPCFRAGAPCRLLCALIHDLAEHADGDGGLARDKSAAGCVQSAALCNGDAQAPKPPSMVRLAPVTKAASGLAT